MSEIERPLNRQASWQKSRGSWSWPEKIRLAERIRESVAVWRRRAPTTRLATPKSRTVD